MILVTLTRMVEVELTCALDGAQRDGASVLWRRWIPRREAYRIAALEAGPAVLVGPSDSVCDDLATTP